MRRLRTVVMIMLTLLLSLPVSAVLTHRYSFSGNPDPGDPNVYDLVGTANATLVGSATISEGQVVLPGTSGNYVNLPGPTINIPSYSAVTIEQWITSSASNTGFTMTFVTGRTGTDGVGYEYLDMQPTRSGATIDGCRFTITNTQWSTEATSLAPQLNDDKEHHLVGVCDNSSITLYLDGVAMPSGTLTTQSLGALSNEVCYLGRSNYTGDAWFAGSINETRIYNNVLNNVAVVLNYQLGPNTYQPCALASMTPANDAINVAIPIVFNWTPEAGITVDHYELFIKTDPNLLDPNSVSVPAGSADYSGGNTTYTKSGVVNDTVYYWRVDTVATDTTRYIGPRYKLRTAPPTPVFTVNPGTSSVFATESAVLTATASSPTALTKAIQWYKVGTPNVEITAGGDVTISETTIGTLTTSTLTINNVTLAQEGKYYAVATNSGGTGQSAQGSVVVKRLLSHYLFDGNANDSVGTNHGTETGSPVYTTGQIGQAVDLDGIDDVVTLPAGVANVIDITIAAWVNWDGGGAWQRIFDFGNSTTQYLFLTPSNNGSVMRFAIVNGGGEQGINLSTALPTGQWVHTAVTLDGNTARLYINGALRGTNTNVTINPSDFNPAINYIGDSQWSADPFMNGRIDDFRIYNYGLTAAEIAALYTDSTPEADFVCLSSISYDINADCRVDLTDLLQLAQNWLGCERVPAESCIE